MPGKLKFTVRTRSEETGDPELQKVSWNPTETAVVICDMWREHWCRGASARVAELAPCINTLVAHLRRAGCLIIHAPSKGMEHYKGTPMRTRAQKAPLVTGRVPYADIRRPDESREGKFPVDDSDGGCFCTPPCDRVEREPYRDYRQHLAIKMEPEDAVTDTVEAYYLMRQRGITNMFIMGVHVNMCVLNRPFGIRQMTDLGQHVVLVRDLTDSMYNPAMPPRVSHYRGTELVVAHIERHWCPSTTSAEFLGGRPFRFADDTGE